MTSIRHSALRKGDLYFKINYQQTFQLNDNHLVKESCLYGLLYFFQQLQGQLGQSVIHIQLYIAYLIIRLQGLSQDIDIMLRQRRIDLRQHPGHILMDMQDPVGSLLVRQAKRRDGMAADGHTGLQVLEQLVADITANVLLGFFRTTADMRGKDHIRQMLQRRLEAIAIFLRLPGIYIDSGAGKLSFLQPSRQTFQVAALTTGIDSQD